MDSAAKRLGRRISELREARGLGTHKALADLVGVSQSSVSQWESGDTSPKGARRELLAKALGVSEADLFSDEMVPATPLPIERQRLEAIELLLTASPGRVETVLDILKGLPATGKKTKASPA